MTKNVATAIELRSPARNAARAKAMVSYCVTVEGPDALWYEVWVDTTIEAVHVAQDSITDGKARGATCWRVLTGGKLARKWFHAEFA